MAALVAVLVLAASAAALTMSIMAIVRSGITGAAGPLGGGGSSAFPVLDTVFDVVSADSSVANSVRMDATTYMKPNSTVVLAFRTTLDFSTILFPEAEASQDIVVLQNFPQPLTSKVLVNPTLGGSVPTDITTTSPRISNLVLAGAVNSGGVIQGDVTALPPGEAWEIVITFSGTYTLAQPRTAVVTAAQGPIALGTAWWVAAISGAGLTIQGQGIGSSALNTGGLLFSYMVL